jgi:hypothetical protein
MKPRSVPRPTATADGAVLTWKSHRDRNWAYSRMHAASKHHVRAELVNPYDVRERAGHQCEFMVEPGEAGGEAERCPTVLELDEGSIVHKVPFVDGGGQTFDNCQLMCERHARSKHGRPDLWRVIDRNKRLASLGIDAEVAE